MDQATHRNEDDLTIEATAQDDQKGQENVDREWLDDDAANFIGEERAENHTAAAISTTEQERDEYKDRYLRTAAELENLNRRFAKEKANLVKFGTEDLMKALLPVLDSFEKALEMSGGIEGSKDDNPFAGGVLLVRDQLLGELRRHGLEAIAAKGQPFDPNVHQAIQRVEGNVSSEIVREEYAKGYTLNGRLLRPSMVSVEVPSESN